MRASACVVASVAGFACVSVAQAQPFVVEEILPSGAVETFVTGAGEDRAVGWYSFLLDPAPFPDARGVHAFVLEGDGTVTDLHPDPSYSASYARSERNGQIVGYGFTSGPNIALLWTGSGYVELVTDGTESSVAQATDGTMQVGEVITLDSLGSPRAFAWFGTAASGRAVAHPSGFDSSSAFGTRDGRIVGTGDDENFFRAALYWADVDASPVILRTPDFEETFATDVYSDSAGVVWVFGEGAGVPTNFARHAMLWNVADLSQSIDLHPANPDYINSYATKVLAPSAAFPDGIQVGTAAYEDIPGSGETFEHACVWFGTSASFVDLHNLLPGTAAFSNATGVDDAGNVYGWYFDRFGTYRGVKWVNQGTVSCPACPADYDQNGGVDGGDLAAFFTDFESGNTCADVDQNGGVDGGDLGAFFAAFEAGGC